MVTEILEPIYYAATQLVIIFAACQALKFLQLSCTHNTSRGIYFAEEASMILSFFASFEKSCNTPTKLVPDFLSSIVYNIEASLWLGNLSPISFDEICK